MNVTINLLETASELADLAVRREMCNNENIEEGDGQWEKVYVQNDNVITYTEEAQKLFNDIYDYYYNVILKYSQNETI